MSGRWKRFYGRKKSSNKLFDGMEEARDTNCSMKKTLKWKIISLSLTIVTIAFIFFQSTRSANVSSEISHGALQLIEQICENIGLKNVMSHHFIRKAAHFSEYFVLGILLTATTRAFFINWRSHLFQPLFFGLLTAVVDETIQLFAEGRASQVTDVLLDFSGIVTGILLAVCILYIAQRIKMGSDVRKADKTT